MRDKTDDQNKIPNNETYQPKIISNRFGIGGSFAERNKENHVIKLQNYADPRNQTKVNTEVSKKSDLLGSLMYYDSLAEDELYSQPSSLTKCMTHDYRNP